MLARQHDAHVRARQRLIKRIVARRYEWGIDRRLWRRVRREGLDLDEVLREEAARQLAAYTWPKWAWWEKKTPYRPYERQRVIGTYKTIPTFVIHQIMCTPVKGES